MEELLEIITWAQLGIHKKTVLENHFHFLLKQFYRLIILYYFLQVGLLNVDGYYNNLLALFDTGVEEGFIKPGARNIVVSAPSAKELLEKMEVTYLQQQQHFRSLFLVVYCFSFFLLLLGSYILLHTSTLLLTKAGKLSNWLEILNNLFSI